MAAGRVYPKSTVLQWSRLWSSLPNNWLILVLLANYLDAASALELENTNNQLPTSGPRLTTAGANTLSFGQRGEVAPWSSLHHRCSSWELILLGMRTLIVSRELTVRSPMAEGLGSRLAHLLWGMAVFYYWWNTRSLSFRCRVSRVWFVRAKMASRG